MAARPSWVVLRLLTARPATSRSAVYAPRPDRPVAVAATVPVLDLHTFVCDSCDVLCRQVSQTDYREDGTVFGSVLNHVTDGRWATGALAPLPPVCAAQTAISMDRPMLARSIRRAHGSDGGDAAPLAVDTALSTSIMLRTAAEPADDMAVWCPMIHTMKVLS